MLLAAAARTLARWGLENNKGPDDKGWAARAFARFGFQAGGGGKGGSARAMAVQVRHCDDCGWTMSDQQVWEI